MPELPEVETTRRGIEPYLIGQTLLDVEVRETRLRWPIDIVSLNSCIGLHISHVGRRGKYLLVALSDQTHLLIHLGMSGSLRLVTKEDNWRKHDHIQWQFSNTSLRFHDPRRFGCVIHIRGTPHEHRLLKDLGPEPLDKDFHSDYLYKVSRERITSIKTMIMDARHVVGIGNIYAQEALFAAGVSPLRRAGSLSRRECELLVDALRAQLHAALAAGGSTLRDFVNGHGEPGYFQLQLNVYGRAGQACCTCKKPLLMLRQLGRSTVYCQHCQR
ncbi:MAG: bifunctional DNA-formamidopyrimidine glycosylase/DNA-(apurinic or apyrimidinic site) lyase [Pseudomonadales bacterium]|nr:bifunctional DNA-formamidopyrimidine glycosylase/DNA-(apurinic or apyrimidinic site) lyase [Pseudomonadales bacterium]